jgi:hypothetical protein
MTHQELDQRISHYEDALKQGKITAYEFEAFLEALARIMRKGK